MPFTADVTGASAMPTRLERGYSSGIVSPGQGWRFQAAHQMSTRGSVLERKAHLKVQRFCSACRNTQGGGKKPTAGVICLAKDVIESIQQKH